MMPCSFFAGYFFELNKEMPIYIYCRSGSRTSKTVALLQQLGIKEIVKLQYGLIDWQRSGYSLRLRH
ncbi:MAG: rhodanese-like domain-containing protein [Bacteroidales bacterium]|nr:rhodanese-like domain-containing protein [Bacteroidales bacterium]